MGLPCLVLIAPDGLIRLVGINRYPHSVTTLLSSTACLGSRTRYLAQAPDSLERLSRPEPSLAACQQEVLSPLPPSRQRSQGQTQQSPGSAPASSFLQLHIGPYRLRHEQSRDEARRPQTAVLRCPEPRCIEQLVDRLEGVIVKGSSLDGKILGIGGVAGVCCWVVC